MNRYVAISPQSQFWLFNVALALNILGMVLTDMWLPMVVGAIVTTYLSVDALVRLRYVIPMKKKKFVNYDTNWRRHKRQYVITISNHILDSE